MKYTVECACSKIRRSVTLHSGKHICNCKTCKKYTNTKSCMFYETSLSKFDFGGTTKYISGPNSERRFCSSCFTFIGMRYYDQDTMYLNKSVLSDTPKVVHTNRHIWTHK